MKLELKHLAPYLSYKLKVKKLNGVIITMTTPYIDYCLNETKPLLRPLSDLTKEIEHKGQRGGDIFIPTRILMCHQFKFCDDKEDLLFNLQSPESIQRCPYNVVHKLLEWHFDVFGLIPEGLAISK